MSGPTDPRVIAGRIRQVVDELNDCADRWSRIGGAVAERSPTMRSFADWLTEIADSADAPAEATR